MPNWENNPHLKFMPPKFKTLRSLYWPLLFAVLIIDAGMFVCIAKMPDTASEPPEEYCTSADDPAALAVVQAEIEAVTK